MKLEITSPSPEEPSAPPPEAEFLPLPSSLDKNARSNSRPSLALVAGINGSGLVLDHNGGGAIEYLIDVSGNRRTEDLGLSDPPDGLSIWSGEVHGHHINTPDANEWDENVVDSYRPLTTREFAALAAGKELFPDLERQQLAVRILVNEVLLPTLRRDLAALKERFLGSKEP